MHRFWQLPSLGLLTVLGMTAAACVGVDPSGGASGGAVAAGEEATGATVTGSTAAPRTTGIPTMRPTSAAELGIALDEFGRPYDNYWGPAGTTTDTRLLTRLQIGGGRLEVIDGDALFAPLPVQLTDTESVHFRQGDELDLRIIWQQRPATSVTGGGAEAARRPPVAAAPDPQAVRQYPLGDRHDPSVVESILGVQVAVPGAEVARWGRFEAAYETRDGLGAITSRAVLEEADNTLEFGQPLLTDVLPLDRPYLLADLDGLPGTDLVLFDNGGGDGHYRLTEGFDEDERLVAVMLWHPRYPWRLAVADGTPPDDITAREDELIDCIEGRRLIDKWGRCT